MLDPNDYLDIYNVRIRPSQIVFRDAFQGRKFNSKLQIQNTGKHKVIVRIQSPSSYAFQIKCIPEGQELSSGLTITRTVHFTYSPVSLLVSHIPIYINEQRLDYQITVELSRAIVSTVPSIIHFGTVDAGLSTTLRVVRLHNAGGQQTPFFVDTPKGDVHDVIVEPNRGILPPRSFVELKFRLISLEEGEVNDEVWIKCNTPLRIPVKATIITPKFEAIHSNVLDRCTVIDFPMTYQGTSSCQNMLIRNYSSNSAMFFFVGVVNGTFLELSKCTELAKEYRHFKVYPRDGRFEAQETKMFRFSFTPQKRKAKEGKQVFYFCQMQVLKVDCKDLRSENYPGGIFTREDDSPRHSRHSKTSRGGEAEVLDSCSSAPVLLTQPGNVQLLLKTLDNANNMRIFLHGMAEEPSVVIIPDQLDLTDLTLQTKEIRVLELRNNSSKLPIILHYKRVPGIDLTRGNIFLKPLESLQISVTINPINAGYISTKIAFDLLFYNYPKSESNVYKVVGTVGVPVKFNVLCITQCDKPILNTGLKPNYIKEVGKNCSNIRFNTKLENTKCVTAGLKTPLDTNCDDLVAFPNDRSASIRPWRSANSCRTIFTKTPRYSAPLETEYEVALTDRELKMELNEFYVTFIRGIHEHFQKFGVQTLDPEIEYELTMCGKIFQTDTDTQSSCLVEKKEQSNFPDECNFSLTPYEIYNIIITPRIIDTGAIPTNHIVSFKINIENKNAFPVRIFIRPDKVNVSFPEGNRTTAKPISEASIKIMYSSTNCGYYTLPLDFIINESLVISVTILANVVGRALMLPISKLAFSEEVLNHYIELENTLNVTIPFEFVYPGGNYQVLPAKGHVAPNSTMTCMVRHLPNIAGRRNIDIDFRSGEASFLQQVHVTSSVRPQPLQVLRKAEFTDLPLNMPVFKKIYIQNDMLVPVSYRVLQCDVSSSKTFGKKEETLPPLGISAMVFNTSITNCVSFTTTIKLEVTQCGIMEIPVYGNVIYPDIIITPKVIPFKKIPCSTTDTQQFIITNCSLTYATVRFQMNDFPEFKITENSHTWDEALEREIFLAADESKTLYVHFIPTEVQSTTFYLPIIINNILGPPIYGDPVTSRVDFYLREVPPESTPNPVPVHLPCMKIYSHAIDPKLLFSTLILNFYHAPQNPVLSTCKLTVTITNPQKVNEDFCICLDDVSSLYVMEIQKNNEVVVCKKNPRIIILPKEQINLIFTIIPHNFTERVIKLPIMLRKEQKTEPTAHNYITLNSIFKRAIITPEHNVIFCKPIPLKHLVQYNNVLTMKNHSPHCKITVKSDLEDCSAEIIPESRKEISHDVSLVVMLFKTTFTETMVFKALVQVSCSCVATAKITYYGCAENCLVTTYVFSGMFLTDRFAWESKSDHVLLEKSSIASSISETSSLGGISDSQFCDFNLTTFYAMYPFAPHDADLKDAGVKCLKDLLDDVVHDCEEWMHSQAFFGTQYPLIPSGINSIDFHRSRAVVKNPERSVIPFAQVLINLIGVQIRSILPLHCVPKNTVDQVTYVYKFYEDMIKFLANMGACFPYLRPEFLLEYQTFQMYMKYNPLENDPSPLVSRISSYQAFVNVSRQAWCDIILQTYKVVCLHRLEEETISKNCSITLRQTPMLRYQRSLRNLNQNIKASPRHVQIVSVLGKGEVKLITWMEFHYNSMRGVLWTDRVPEEREVNFFGDALCDGLVFGAITATYCPYLIEEIKKMYTSMTTYEENIHNNVVLIKCWEMVNYSLRVTPEILARPRPIKLLMLVSYLYEVLPYMYPGETIEIKAGLSQKSTVLINVQNKNTFSIAYKVIFFSNELNCFSIEEPIYVIRAKTEADIIIEYYAKFAQTITATLLLSGEVMGYHFAKNKTYTLIGSPDLEYMTSTVTFTTALYSSIQKTSKLKSPHDSTASYEMKLSFEPISTPQELATIPYWSSMVDIKYHRIVPLHKSMLYNNGVGELRFVCNACFRNTMDTRIFFSNEQYGDFAILLRSKVKPVMSEEQLIVTVPRFIDNYERIYVNIPSRHTILWKVFKEYLLKVTTGNERIFWDKNLDTNKGMHLIYKIVITNTDMYKEFCSTKTFKLLVNKDCGIEFPTEVTLQDVCSMDDTKVAVTLSRNLELPVRIRFCLEPTDGSAKRYYSAAFVYDE